MENKMVEVAKLLGVELEEEFKIEGFCCKYKLTNDGLMYWSYLDNKWLISTFLKELLTGELKIIKLPKPIIDDVEKEYLSNIIKPFIKTIKYVIKNKKLSGNYEYISIAYYDSTGSCALNFPDFKSGAMYRGMEIGRPYTLTQLGL